ncbi:extracellular solute-binding protein [Sneathiella limimaris]|uniref:extracellular solute-binding protein n=1 Tax=Sneathiella limimaris TaxID=1964213 RepID=UPI00146F9237|nr:extracellular solute-binding protein [Sneathiella limimaris]
MRFLSALKSASLILVGALSLQSAIAAEQGIKTHGLSSFGNLKYGADFAHFDYVDPNAPKGGSIRLRNLNSFDSVNPFILKGVSEVLNSDKGGDLFFNFATLMTRAHDEPDAVYGLVAKEADLDPDGKWVEFHLREGPQFHDGSPITPDDIVFSFETLKNEGHPRYQVSYKDIESAKITGPASVRFDFNKNALTRGLALQVATMPILSKVSFETRAFNETTLEPLLGSGPYKIVDVQPGRSVTYERIKNHWAENLPVHVGRFNFDSIQVDYYRDRTIALEAFFAGEYDFREEFTSRSWAVEYDGKPAFKNGSIIKETLPDASMTGFQAFFFNTRLEKFSDIRVRRAIARMFDFEWTNKNLFYDSYERLTSIFENSEMKAIDSPSDAELALLTPWKEQLPPEVFGASFVPEKTKGDGRMRTAIRQSLKDLKEAGWTIQDKKLLNSEGQPFTMEFLLYSRSFERIINPFIRNLERIGIQANIRLLDLASWQNRMQEFDFEIATRRFGQPAYPGVELRNWWGSGAAKTVGGLNVSGIQSPAVDSLIESIIKADNKEDLVVAARALDRVIMHSHVTIPQWFKASHFVAFWDKFGRPEAQKPGYDRAALHSWWYDPEKAAKLKQINGQ